MIGTIYFLTSVAALFPVTFIIALLSFNDSTGNNMRTIPMLLDDTMDPQRRARRPHRH